MTPTSAGNLSKELNQFFDWIEAAEEFQWEQPKRFHKIVRTPVKLTTEEQYQKRERKKRSVIQISQLKTLFEYALPTERILLLLGLNCALGAAECGQLRTGFLDLDNGVIDGVRFKTGNETKHRLWPQTVSGLKWVLEERRQQQGARPEYQDIVFLTDRGRPLWHHTKKGNASNGIATAWNRLIGRVQKDDEHFPSYSFNKLRKTSATRILEIADAAAASMILAHGTISDDRLLECYVQIPWQKLFKAQEQFAAELGEILDAGNPNPWEPAPKNYIGLKKVKKIIELDGRNVPATEIAKQLRLNIATVYRQLQRKHGKRRPGRKAMYDRPAIHNLAEAPDRRLGFSGIHTSVIDLLPYPIKCGFGIGGRIEGFPAIEFVGRKNLAGRSTAVFLSGPHHGFRHFQRIVALTFERIYRAVLGSQDDRIPDNFQGFVPVGLAGGDFFLCLAPLWLEFVAAEGMLPIGCVPTK